MATNAPISPGFEFPESVRDTVDRKLRESVQPTNPQLQSVRPERQRIVQTNPQSMQQAPVPAPVQQAYMGSNTVPNVQPSPSPMQEPTGTSIDLPSKFFYYGFKDLYVKPFRVVHLAKVAKAAQTQSMQVLAEVVSSVLSTPSGETDLAFKLTMADFNAVLYWLRMNSFAKQQMRVEWFCQDPDHNHRVEVGESSKETLKNTMVYKDTDITTNALDNVPDPAYFNLQGPNEGDIPVALRPETVIDAIQFLDDARWEDEEFQYLAKLASVIDLPKLSLSDKIQFVEAHLTTDQTLIIQEFLELSDKYGIEEFVNTKCSGCGASQRVKLVVDAPCFLSPKF